MYRNKIDKLTQKIEEDDYMIILPVPSDRLPVIDNDKTIEFIKNRMKIKLLKSS